MSDPYDLSAPLEAAPINLAEMCKAAMWMIENYKTPVCRGPHLMLHPKEIERIEARHGSIDRWWKDHVSTGQIWRELLDGRDDSP